jgi:hypothetical protein
MLFGILEEFTLIQMYWKFPAQTAAATVFKKLDPTLGQFAKSDPIFVKTI